MLKRLLGYLAPQKVKTAGLISTMLITVGVEAAIAWPLKVVVDNILGEQPLWGYSLVLLLALATGSYVLLAGSRGILKFLRRRWLEQLSQSAGLRIRDDLYTQMQRLGLRFHDRSRTGDLGNHATSDVDELQQSFVNAVSIFSVDLLSIIGITAVMFFVDWRLALVSMIVLPPLFFLFVFFRRRVKAAQRQVRAEEGEMASQAQEMLASIRVVKVFSGEDREQERFMEQTHERADASVRAASSEGGFAFWVEVFTATGIAFVVGYGAYGVASGFITLGTLILFVQYQDKLFSPVRNLSRLMAIIQRAAASGERIEDVLREEPEVEEAKDAVPLKPGSKSIVFEDVRFGYDPETPVLKGINLEVDAGDALAVVGPTGEGKSTLAALVPRLYDADDGRILIEGTDVRDLKLRSLRESISLVLQASILLSGTIRENIAYSKPDAPDEEVEAAAKAAHAHEFIAGFPEGYDSAVGEGGIALSGGQRQRIAITCTLLKDAPVLILDEPTSAVDTESEGLIKEALKRLIKGQDGHYHHPPPLGRRVCREGRRAARRGRGRGKSSRRAARGRPLLPPPARHLSRFQGLAEAVLANHERCDGRNSIRPG